MEVFENLDLDKLLYGQTLLSLLTTSFLPSTSYNVAIFLYGLSSLEATSTNRLRQFMALLVMSILVDVVAIAKAPDETSTLGSFLAVVNMFLKFLSSWATLGSLRARELSTFGGPLGTGYAPMQNDWRGARDAQSLGSADLINAPAPPLPNKQNHPGRYSDLEGAPGGVGGGVGGRPTTGLPAANATNAPLARPSTGKPLAPAGVSSNDIRVEGYHTIE